MRYVVFSPFLEKGIYILFQFTKDRWKSNFSFRLGGFSLIISKYVNRILPDPLALYTYFALSA